jgi:ABC-type glutathione transport system ATPase component
MIPALEIDSLDISLLSAGNPPAPIVKSLSLRLDPGEIAGLAGESGSGKSLTALATMRLLSTRSFRVEARSMRLAGVETSQLSDEEMRQRRGSDISMIFQEPMSSLNPSMRIGDLLAETMHRRRERDPGAIRRAAIESLRRVRLDDPERILRAFPHQLSGGMRQRVMIAMAFCNSPKVLIADEPTTSLDVSIQADILSLLKDLAGETGCAILMISHDLAVMSGICRTIHVMREGRIVESGPVPATLLQPAHPYTRLLLSSLPDNLPHRARLPLESTGSASGVPPRALTPDADKARKGDGAIVVEARDLSVSFKIGGSAPWTSQSALLAVSGVTFGIRKGETLSIIGESGSGKTTLARTLVGLQAPTSGSVEVLGEPPRQAARSGRLQMIFQDPRTSLSPRLPAWRLVTEPLYLHGERHGLRARAAELLARTGLPADALDRGPREFSGGQRQRLAIARALSTDPDILVLDEPTSALDVSVQARILNLLLDLQDEQGLTYILVTHDMSIVAHLSDRIAVMKTGQVIEEGLAAEVLKRPRNPYTQALIGSTPRLPDGVWRPSHS